jgi:poly(3-hydroxybutyrate) depolymerase
MSTIRACILFTVSALFGSACSAQDVEPQGSTAGTSPSAGTAGIGAGGGGTSAGGGGGGAPMAGSGGSAGSLSTSGSGSGGQGGTAGSGQAGNAGTSGNGGSGNGPATPSGGCAKATPRPQGGSVTVAGKHYFTFPESYDGTKPLPVLVGFHGCGDVNRGTDLNSTEWIRLTESSAFKTEYVRAVPVSAATGGCWSYGTDITRTKAMYDELLENYCVDTSRVFATGHSSGAQYIVQILLNSHAADAQYLKFKGVAPVAASDYGAMKGPIPVMYIQGKMDAERGNGDGHETVAQFRTANSCQMASMPYSAVMGCQSGTTAVNPGCVTYEGCQAPTVWCSHNDPAYGTTMHGVPCFGVKAMYDFFQSLK